MPRPAAVLLDIAGVLHDGQSPYPGAVESVGRLKDAGLELRFVTNTSRRTRGATLERLRGFGFRLTAAQIYTAPLAARHYLEERRLRPLLLIHPDLAPDFEDMDTRDPNAVFVGDAGEHFSYATLDSAFRLLSEGAPLVAVGRNRYFRDGETLHLDAGPFVAALEYASGQTATVAGKPSAAFFRSVLDDAGVAADGAVMIGDDVEADVLGAQAQGVAAILVQTGKYRDADGDKLAGSAARIARDLSAAVDMILED